MREMTMTGSELPLEDWEVLVEDWEVLDLLSSLVDKSLVVAEPSGEGTRYRLLETVRQYGRERLADSGEGEAAQGRHLAYYLALVEEAEPHLRGAEQIVWLNRLEVEHDNLRLALRLALETSDRGGRADAALSLCGKLFIFWSVRGHLAEGREWCAEALALPFPSSAPAEAASSLRASVLYAAAGLASSQGDYEAARGFLEQSGTLCQELGYKQDSASVFHGLGDLANNQGDYEVARGFYEQSLPLCREMGSKQGVAYALLSLGNVASSQVDYNAAQSFFEQGQTLFQEIGHKRGLADALGGLGVLARDQGDYAAARSFYEQCLTLRWELGDKRLVAITLGNLGDLAGKLIQWERRTGLYGAMGALRVEIGAPLAPIEQADHDAAVAEARAALGEVAFAAAWDKGQAMTLDEAVEYALTPLQQNP